jgi:glutathione peroxidase
MKNIYMLILMAAISSCSTKPIEMETTMNKDDIYNIEITTISGDNVKMGDYKGKVILIVNTASKCGYTKQYDGLQKLYEEYKDQGLVILGFPSNNFLRQEPGSNTEIESFCRLNYGVSFPMFEKVSVKGKDICPLYEYLTSKVTNPDFGGKITWNFNKFLISTDGTIANRFKSGDTPESDKIKTAIEDELKN